MEKKEKFVFADKSKYVEEQAFVGAPVGYFKDAWRRFKKNKASLVASGIILFLALFAVLAPIFSPYTVAYQDDYYKFRTPKNPIFVRLGWDFWDGCAEKKLPEHTFYYYLAMGEETGRQAIKRGEYKKENTDKGAYYSFRLDGYEEIGCVFLSLTNEEYVKLQNYQDRTNRQVLYPTTNPSLRPDERINPKLSSDANYWYEYKWISGRDETGAPSKQKVLAPVFDEEGNFQNIYAKYSGKDGYFSSMRTEGTTPLYDYAIPNQTGVEVRVNYYEYYRYYHADFLKDGVEEPVFLFGTTQAGKDVFTCLGSGARLSFLLAISVSLVNMLIGGIYGAIEGYFGGAPDLVMERISDILNAVPFMIVITLLKMHLGDTSQLLVLLIAFFLTGWISMAKRTRLQFYRFKNREYALAARTLGASNKRIMWKHIFPNAIGTIITGSVLSIPATIFSESSLSYLGIINLNTGNLTSIGTLLSNAQPYLTSYPYMILFPAVFICLLMLSFNLFGNGLRDAFNPSLRGVE